MKYQKIIQQLSGAITVLKLKSNGSNYKMSLGNQLGIKSGFLYSEQCLTSLVGQVDFSNLLKMTY